MFRKVIVKHYYQVGLNYVCGRCTKTEFNCAMSYLKILHQRVIKHYKRIAERN